MLDEQDNTTTNTSTDSGTDTPPAAPAARAPRKRAPAKKAADGEPAGPARKRPAKKAAAAAGTDADKAPVADTEVKPARKRPAKKAAETAATDEVADTEAKPKKKAAKKPAKKSGHAVTAADAAAEAAAAAVMAAPGVLFQPPAEVPPPRRRRATADGAAPVEAAAEAVADPDEIREAAVEEATGARRRRRRGRRGRGSGGAGGGAGPAASGDDEADDADVAIEDDHDEQREDESDETESGDGTSASTRRRRRRRRSSGGAAADAAEDDPPNTVVHVRAPREETGDGVKGVKGSTRLEAKRQRRRDGRETNRRRAPILTEAEFLARREAVERVMAVRQTGQRTQIAVLEDDVLVEHYVTRASATSYVGNVYLGRVQNVLPSMEAAFIDIGKGRNGVLYAGEVNWDAAGLEGKSRAIEQALKSGDVVLVQVTKDPIGHKGARLTSQVSLPGRYLVYVPGGGMTGISRRLPDTERHRLKAILKKIVPEDAGVIVRTAAEGASEEELTRDVERLRAQWESIDKKAQKTSAAPTLVHGEPDLAIRVVRDVFNEDFKQLIVQGDDAWQTVSDYITSVAPDLGERVSRHTTETDLFHEMRVDEQLMKGLDRKVWLPSGGSLVIDRTEAMTVIDVNTGKFVGSGGNLEETVTRNNLEAAEEIVRQLRLRDVGGIVVIDFIDMVLESNRDLVLRRLTECLGRDRTKHQVAEVTSLGLVQMTRKRVGEGLLEAFSEPCEVCKGRGVVIHAEPVDRQVSSSSAAEDEDRPRGKRKRGSGTSAARKASSEPSDEDQALAEAQRQARVAAISAIHAAAHHDEESGDEPDEAEVAQEIAELTEAVDVVAELIAEASGQLAEEPAADEVEADEPSADEPGADEPVVEEPAAVAAAPAPRRRRAASRPAGPPVVAQSG